MRLCTDVLNYEGNFALVLHFPLHWFLSSNKGVDKNVIYNFSSKEIHIIQK